MTRKARTNPDVPDAPRPTTGGSFVRDTKTGALRHVSKADPKPIADSTGDQSEEEA